MMIPIRCEVCNDISHMKRLAYAWVTFCNTCFLAQVKYDDIHLGSEKSQ